MVRELDEKLAAKAHVYLTQFSTELMAGEIRTLQAIIDRVGNGKQVLLFQDIDLDHITRVLRLKGLVGNGETECL